MTTSRTILLSAVLALALPPAQAMAADGWGASWSFGPTKSRIIHAKTTLVPGRFPPMTNVGPLFLWPGLSNPTSDLIQTTMDAWEGTENSSYCKATAGQWCVEASVFGSFGQINGPTVAIDPDDHVTIEYTLQADNNTWLQTVTSQKLGRVVSTLTSKSGQMPNGGFGFATEADNNSFTIDTQYYLCTEIDLFAADPSFGGTGVGGRGAQMGATGVGSGVGTAKNLHTPDNGKTWLVDLITLPAMNPQGPQTPPPAIDCTTGGGTSSSSSSSSSSGSSSASSTSSSSSGSSSASSSSSSSGHTSSSSGGVTSSSSSGGTSSSSSGTTSSTSSATSSASGATSSGSPGSGGAGGGGGNDAGERSGCSCRVPSGRGPAAGSAMLALGLLGIVRRRRRRRASSGEG
jgi:MYXO-CTERM domain-containing protein